MLTPHPRCKRCKGQGKYKSPDGWKVTCDCAEARAEEAKAIEEVKKQFEETTRGVKGAKKTPKPMPVKKNAFGPAEVVSPCKHKRLHFEAGGLHIVCSNTKCGQAWQALNNERLIPNFLARGWGFNQLDVRKDPLS